MALPETKASTNKKAPNFYGMVHDIIAICLRYITYARMCIPFPFPGAVFVRVMFFTLYTFHCIPFVDGRHYKFYQISFWTLEFRETILQDFLNIV